MRIPRYIISFFFLFSLFTITNQNGLALAQIETGDQSVVVPEALSPEAMSALVSKLDEEQTEALIKLMELLNASAGSETSDPTGVERAPMSDIVMGWVIGFGDAMLSHISNLPTMIAGVGAGIESIFAGRGLGGSLWFLTLLTSAIAIGLGAEWVFNWITAGKQEEIKGTSPDSLLETLKMLSRRAVIQIGGLIVFAVVAVFAIRILFSEETDRLIATSFVLQALLIARISAALLRFVLAPTRTDLRLVSTDDQTAQYIYWQLVSIAAVVGAALFLAAVMDHFGIMVIGAFRFWVGLFVTAWVIYVTWRARDGLTSIIRGEEEYLTPGLEKMATWWPAFSIVIIALSWLLTQLILSTGNQALTPGRSALTLALIVVAPFLDTMVRGIAAHLVPAMQGEGPVAEKAYHETRLCYVRMGRIVLFTVLIFAFAKLLGVNLYNLTETGLGSQIAADSVGFLLILAFGYMAWEITNLWINRRLAQELPQQSEGEESGEAGGAGLSRMATILPILRMTLQATIITITALLALSQLGVNITPLLAGAGVLGLAIGFGAQTLVKDVVSGVFFLLDDAFRVGEYIDVGGTQGTVEKISVRSLQLRGATGPVHIVPYGSMSSLTNMSRDWVTMKLKFTVPFDTDLEKVRKIFKKIGQQIQEVPEYAEDLISPFKSQGAADVTDVGIVVRGKFTTKPGGQWGIRKEIYNRVQKAFEENGIEFARKEVWVQIPGQEEETKLSADQKKAISAAAGQAAEPTTTAQAPEPT